MSAFEDNDAFGDLQADKLPAFFTDQGGLDENYDFSQMADMAALLDDEVVPGKLCEACLPLTPLYICVCNCL
jgi:hypothetical protein